MTTSIGRIEFIDEQMVKVPRGKSPADRLAIAHGMWRSARRMMQSSIRAANPAWSEKRLQEELAGRLSGGDV